jgi:hypothetical protein
MKYSLRSLMVVVVVAPPLLAAAYFVLAPRSALSAVFVPMMAALIALLSLRIALRGEF